MMSGKWHQHVLRVHYKETDQMAVVHHANYVSWFEIGRTEMMRDLGIAYRDMEALGLLLPVLDIKIEYHAPARYDDCIAVYTKLTDYSAVRLQYHYDIRRINKTSTYKYFKEPEGELLASGYTLHMWLNKQWRPARLDRLAPDIYESLEQMVSKK